MNPTARRSKTRVLVDGGDPDETLRVRNLVGYVDGQTLIQVSLPKIRKCGTLYHPGTSSALGKRWMNTRRL
jgi:hypothetical protein